MSSKKCRECGREVSSEDTECPDCGARLKDRSKLGCLSGIVIILILWWLGFYYGRSYISNDASSDDVKNASMNWQDQDNSIVAYIKIQDYVKQDLNAPVNVKFPEIVEKHSDYVKRIGDQKYLITSYVDYENSAGTKMRTRFIGEIQQISEHEWNLISLYFLKG
ncbi:MAG: hypothetical protein JSW20_10385 [Nitrospiraceae bacterium]|nr:MAG: hypothetical protein JSW20_10385 [Nitrospiraceae bacterium]